MPKFLFIGDRHNSETIPSSRIDNYHENIELKDLEIIQIAKDKQVDAILHPGDFWTDSDRKLNNEFVAKTALKWMSANIRLIGIAGNHDLIGNNLNSLDSTTTGLLNSLGIFKTLKDGEEIIFDDGVSVAITGTNFHKGMDKPENIKDYIVTNKSADYHIHIVHGMLTAKSYGKLFDHTTIDQILDTKADITLCGHDHVGFGIVNYKNKYFINPGAVVRMNCNKNEMNREVSVVYIEIDKNGIKCELIPLKSAKPANEVLSRAEIEAEEERESYKAFIKDGVEKLKIGGNISITDVLEDIYSRDEIPENIRKDITESVTNKTRDITTARAVAATGNRIVKVRLYNFQSHEDTEIELDEHLNIIVGESNQGKTSVLRAIRWVAENKPSGKGMVRRDKDDKPLKDCSVTLTLENGTIIIRYISGKENGYKIYYPNGDTASGNTTAVKDVQKILGWCNMKIGENEEIPLNYLKQTASAYLIGDKYTGSDRARILGAINHTEGADATIKEIEKSNSKIDSAIKYETTEIAVLSNEIGAAQEEKARLLHYKELIQKAILVEKIREYLQRKNDFLAAQKELDDIDAKFDEVALANAINRIKDQLKKLDLINSKLQLIDIETRRVETINPMIDEMTNSLTNIGNTVTTIRANIDKYNRILNLTKNIANYVAESKHYYEIECQLSLAANLDTKTIQNKINICEQIMKNLAVIQRAEWSMAAADKFIDASSSVSKFDTQKKHINESIERYNKIVSILNQINTLNQEVKTRDDSLMVANQKHKDAITNKTNILKQSHVCPTCYSEIDEHVILEIIKKQEESTNE